MEKTLQLPMNYLFLGIEGVLDTERYRNILAENGLSGKDSEGEQYDPEALQNLERIIEATDAKIVIASTFRSDDYMQDLWKRKDLPGKVIGITQTLYREKSIGDIIVFTNDRGMEVEAWLEDNATFPFKYAILDDEDCYLEAHSDHLVLTDPMTGITKEVADKVINLLD